MLKGLFRLSGLFLLPAAIVGCRAGGGVTASPSISAPTVSVAVPTIASPATRPFYSKDDTLTITGMCMTGYTVYLSGDTEDQQTCTSSQYSFSVLQLVDGLYSFQVSQSNDQQTTSAAVPVIWVRKTSVSAPTIISPSASPFASAQNNLSITGTCETGSTIALTGAATASTSCLSSAFSFVVNKVVDGDYTMTVQQTDRAGNSASSTVQWAKHELAVTPGTPTIVAATPQVFSISGGSGFYIVTIQTNSSGGSYNSTTNTYTPGTVAGGIDTLRFTDSLGAIKTATITIAAGAADHLELPAINGDGQVKTIGQNFDDPVYVKVVDRYGNGIPNYQLLFNLIGGDAEVRGSPIATTASDGRATVQLKSGYQSTISSFRVQPLSGSLPDLAVSGKTTLTVTATASATGNGNLGTIFPAGQNPGGLVAIDINSDGKKDIVVINAGDPSLGRFIAKGNGLYQAMSKINGLCPGGNAIASADFNADGKADLAIACGGNDAISIYLGNGDGSFQNPVLISTAPGETIPTALVTGDFNGDTKIDIAFTSAGGSLVGVLLGVGNGSFGTVTTVNVGLTPNAIAATDLDKDGKADLVVSNASDNTLSVLNGDGAGGFTVNGPFGVGVAPVSISIADLNKDTWPDVVVACNGDDSLGVLLNDGTGVLDTPSFSTVGSGPTATTIADLDADGNLDIAVSNSGDSTMSVLYGQGNGVVNPAVSVSVVTNPLFVFSDDANGDGTQDLFLTGDGKLQLIPIQTNGTLGLAKATGLNPTATAVGDFNGDGKLDTAVANSGANTVSVFTGNGDGTFPTSITLSTGTNPSSVTVADLNDDNKSDILVTNQGSASARLFIGAGDGTFAAPSDITTASGPTGLVVTDLNADGKLDLAVACANTNKLSVILGNGDGTFQAKADLATGASPAAIAAADFNGDGVIDLVSANNSSNDISVHIGNGGAAYQTAVTYVVGNGPVAAIAQDFNNDGRIDLAVTNATDGTISILRGVGDGSFSTNSDFSCGPTPLGLISGDFNGDSKVDLAVVNSSSQSLTVLPGTGNALFSTSNSITTTYTVNGLVPGDFNADGALDLLVLDSTYSKAHTWLGQ